ncbi:amino acid ABC transporter substrate-binding protein [Bacillus timonensis]|nr:amino acid ABC transporter substrate-binding protein [Bacillus timonensis]
MKKLVSLSFVLMLILSVALVGCKSKEATTEAKTSILDTVKKRGKLVAGVNGQLPGFGYVESDGTYTGFDIDFAKAIAAAVLGDANAIEFRPLSAQERFTAVQTGEVDVLVRNTTWTTSRDTGVGLNFAPVTFYDGQGLMVRKDSGVTSLKDLEGMRIGVETGTTTELNLADQMRKLGVNYEQVKFESADAVVAAYEQGSIDAWTTDKSGLVSRLSIMKNPSEHKILNDSLSKEPLAPAVIAGDDKWFDIVKWVVNVTIEAEELGITSKNVDEFVKSEDPVIQRLLGTDGDLGKQLGLDADFAVKVIKQVGNYGEIFERHLGKGSVFGLERGQNDLHTNGGLLYSPPFR